MPRLSADISRPVWKLSRRLGSSADSSLEFLLAYALVVPEIRPLEATALALGAPWAEWPCLAYWFARFVRIPCPTDERNLVATEPGHAVEAQLVLVGNAPQRPVRMLRVHARRHHHQSLLHRAVAVVEDRLEVV